MFQEEAPVSSRAVDQVWFSMLLVNDPNAALFGALRPRPTHPLVAALRRSFEGPSAARATSELEPELALRPRGSRWGARALAVGLVVLGFGLCEAVLEVLTSGEGAVTTASVAPRVGSTTVQSLASLSPRAAPAAVASVASAAPSRAASVARAASVSATASSAAPAGLAGAQRDAPTSVAAGRATRAAEARQGKPPQRVRAVARSSARAAKVATKKRGARQRALAARDARQALR